MESSPNLKPSAEDRPSAPEFFAKQSIFAATMREAAKAAWLLVVLNICVAVAGGYFGASLAITVRAKEVKAEVREAFRDAEQRLDASQRKMLSNREVQSRLLSELMKPDIID